MYVTNNYKLLPNYPNLFKSDGVNSRFKFPMFRKTTSTINNETIKWKIIIFRQMLYLNINFWKQSRHKENIAL